MFVLVYREFKHVGLGILAIGLGFNACVIIKGMYTCKTRHFVNKPLCLDLCFLDGMYSGKLGILAWSLCVYIYVLVGSVYKCKNGNFGYEPSFL